MSLKITENTYYGKLLGGCCYAGLPISKTITIQLSDEVYIELDAYMFINEDLNYYVGFTWTDSHDWKDLPFSYLRDDFKKIVAKINGDDFDWNWEKEAFLDMFYGENIMNDEPVFCLNNVKIKLTDENQERIKAFLNQMKQIMVNFLKEAEMLYISRKDTIGWN